MVRRRIRWCLLAGLVALGAGHANALAANRAADMVNSTTVASTTTTTSPLTTVTSTAETTTTTTTSTTSTTTTVPIPPLVLPYKLYFTQLANRTSRRMGFALLQQSPLPGTLRLTAYGDTGKNLKSSVVLSLASRNQMARVVYEKEIFGSGLGNVNGWLLVESDRPGLAGFFLLYNDSLTLMDGTDVSDRICTQMILPEVRNAEIALVNPGEDTAVVTMHLMSDQGVQIGKTAYAIPPPMGRTAGPLSIWFSTTDLSSAGYLKIGSNLPLAGSEFFGTPDKSLTALNALDMTAGEKTLYAPQYVAGGSVYTSSITLINLESTPTRLFLTFLGDDGRTLGQTAVRDLPGSARMVVSDASPMGIPASGTQVQGYLRIQSDRTRIDGFVTFGGLGNLHFQTALPLIYQSRSSMVFSQIAQNETFFTGLAVVNPNGEAVDTLVSLYDTDGTRIGVSSVSIPANGRISRLLKELVPGMPPMSRGYFRILSSRPVLGFGVFGTTDYSVLSAILPQ